MKLKERRKPFPANNASRKKLEAEGWTVTTVEQRLPHCFITKDAFGFGDLLACSPTRGIMLVQVTAGLSTNNLHPRIAKIRKEPRAALWLAAGGRIQVHSWEGRGSDRECRIMEVTAIPAEPEGAIAVRMNEHPQGACEQ